MGKAWRERKQRMADAASRREESEATTSESEVDVNVNVYNFLTFIVLKMRLGNWQ